MILRFTDSVRYRMPTLEYPADCGVVDITTSTVPPIEITLLGRPNAALTFADFHRLSS